MTTLETAGAGPGNRFAAAVAALTSGAIAMGIAPVFVRLAEVGPFVSAFWRVVLALPFLWLWARLETRGRASRHSTFSPGLILAGLLFAGDLVFWHLAILHTTIANATLLATLSPVWVVLGSRFFLGETVARATIGGLLMCIAGAALLVGASFSVAPERFMGDLCGLIVSAFFGGYVLSVRRLRQTMGAGELMYRSSVITAAGLLVVALAGGGAMWPSDFSGVGALVAIALLSHVGGQGLTAFALGHLPAAFSSLVIFLEALAAAVTGYVVFDEAMTPLQIAGAALLVAGIIVARPRRARAQ